MDEKHAWIHAFPAAITVCDPEGIILEMNEEAAKSYEKWGGMDLIGKNMFFCHSSASQEKLRVMLDNQQPNVYTIEKKGKKMLIYQQPWYKDGVYGGFVELDLPLPADMPHFKRD
jgi:transcriptional regulator with PAS, ATPase and Fis domain